MAVTGLGRGLVLLVALAGMLASTGVSAEEDRAGPEGASGKKERPRMEACANASEGDDCTFTARSGKELKGKCAQRRVGLVCLSEQANRPRGPVPPVAACQSASQGDACSFESLRGEHREGECKPWRGRLVCFPEGAKQAPAPEPPGTD